MYTAVIIDDEQIVVKGIRSQIDWDGLGIEVIGTASDGDEGLNLIYANEPDIVISDIRMPTMSGLEMCRILHNSDIFPQIIFVSGYNDHDYAREMLKLSAVDYILKPFNPKDLEKILRSCVDRLGKQASYVENFNYFNMQTTLSDVLTAPAIEMDTALCDEISDTYHLTKGAYNVLILVHLDHYSAAAPKREEYDLVKECRRYLRNNPDIPQDVNTIVIDLKRKDRTAVFFSCFDQAVLKQAVQNAMQYIQERVSQLLGESVLCGVSEISDNIAKLRVMLLHAKKALHFSYFDNQTHVYYYDTLPEVSLDIGTVKDKFVNLIRVRDAEACYSLLPDLFLYYSNQEADVFPQLKLDCLKICNMVEFVLSDKEKQAFGEEIKQIELVIMGTKSFREVYEKMIDLITITTEDAGNMEKKTDAAISAALRYIDEHIHEPITLSDVANHVHFSQSRFSVKFSQIVGEPFSKYLAKERIQKATELLKQNPFLKVYEVAEMVGYTNARYFGTLFKKTMGITPLQYVSTLGQNH